MTTSEFKKAVAEQESVIRSARDRLEDLTRQAVEDLCPVKIGDETEAYSLFTSDHRTYRAMMPMIVTSIQIITPIFNDNWEFRIRGDIKNSSDRGENIIPFPEN